MHGETLKFIDFSIF